MKSGVKFELVTAIPKPEVWLSSKGKKNFTDLCELLIRHQLLDIANVQLVAIMSEEWAMYEKACRELKKEGEVMELKGGYRQASPWVSIRNQAQKNYREVAAMFGLDLLSSQKIGPAAHDQGDEFDKLTKAYE
jgi:P27 family predicted phage terminase small subunit